MATKPKKREPEKPKIGRPTEYHEGMPHLARQHVLLGATLADLADLFDVSRQTINVWMAKHHEFVDAINQARADMDAQVEKSLFQRAMGYKAKAVRHFYDGKTGEVVTAEFVEHYPPDNASMIFWLKNRQPQRWRAQPMETEDVPTPVRVTVKVENASMPEPADD